MKKSPVSIWQALIGSLLIVILLILQSSRLDNGQLVVEMNSIIFLLINYLTWAFMIQLVYSWLLSIDLNIHSVLTKLVPRFIGLMILHLIISNLIFVFFEYIASQASPKESLNSLLDILPRAIASRGIDLLVIFAILKILDSQRHLNAQQMELSELKGQLTQSKLDALHMQLNPHFLFNALHAVHSLIGHDNEKSRKMLINISALFRKMLELGNQQLIPVDEELELVEAFLAIEKERFHDRLTVTYNINSEAKDTLIPSLLLQPLLENSLKHGISVIEGKGEIKLGIQLRSETTEITLGNNYSPKTSSTTSTGIGLQNVRRRLETLFPSKFEMNIKSESNWFAVHIIIPRHDI